jgi:hypothetical protein
MKLSDIRKASTEQLKDAVRNLISNMSTLTLGEIHATSRTIFARAKKIGLTVDFLNNVATEANQDYLSTVKSILAPLKQQESRLEDLVPMAKTDSTRGEALRKLRSSIVYLEMEVEDVEKRSLSILCEIYGPEWV